MGKVADRSTWAWLAGPLAFIFLMCGIAVAERLAGPVPLRVTLAAQGAAFAIAWAAWWPFFKPKISFLGHAVIGVAVAGLVVALRLELFPLSGY